MKDDSKLFIGCLKSASRVSQQCLKHVLGMFRWIFKNIFRDVATFQGYFTDVLTVSQEGYLIVIDKVTGNILRSTYILNNKNKKVFPTGFIVAKSFVYVSLSNGRLLKVNIEDGKTKDIIKIDGDKISRPYILNKNMYILRNDAIVKVE